MKGNFIFNFSSNKSAKLDYNTEQGGFIIQTPCLIVFIQLSIFDLLKLGGF